MFVQVNVSIPDEAQKYLGSDFRLWFFSEYLPKAGKNSKIPTVKELTGYDNIPGNAYKIRDVEVMGPGEIHCRDIELI